MAENFTLKAGTKVFVGNVAATLAADTEVVFESVDGPDALAEALAQSPSVYAAHREELAHNETVVRDGETVHLRVSYGIGGARSEFDQTEFIKELDALFPQKAEQEQIDPTAPDAASEVSPQECVTAEDVRESAAAAAAALEAGDDTAN